MAADPATASELAKAQHRTEKHIAKIQDAETREHALAIVSAIREAAVQITAALTPPTTYMQLPMKPVPGVLPQKDPTLTSAD